MADEEESQSVNAGDQSSAPAGVPLEGGREVTVNYSQSLPPAAEKVIHPRRLAPIVPEHRAEREN
jgi:hypothetical protein